MPDKMNLNINTGLIRDAIVNFIVPIVSLGVSVLLFVIIIRPSFSSAPKLRSELELKKVLQGTLTKKLGALEKLVDYKSVVDENSKLVNRVLVSEELVPQLLNQVHEIAKDSGLEVTRLAYSYGETAGGTLSSGTEEKKPQLGYKVVYVSLGTYGSVDQLVSFLESCEKAARFISVENVRYATSEKEGQPTLSMSFSLSSPYIFVQSNAVTDDPVTLDIASPDFVSFINKLKTLKYYEVASFEQVMTETKETTQSTQ